MNEMNDFKLHRKLLTTSLLACLAGLLSGLPIWMFQSHFVGGATLSGIHPVGGPGFLLLLIPAGCAWINWHAQRVDSTRAFLAGLVVSAFGALLVSVLSAFFVAQLLSDEASPLVSSSGFSFLVASATSLLIRWAERYSEPDSPDQEPGRVDSPHSHFSEVPHA